jgi:hypothetical protein
MRTIVKIGILIYALGFLFLFYVTYPSVILMMSYQPAMSFLLIVSGLAAFILLGSAIGLFFRKRIAYYTAIISLAIIGFSGIIKNIWIEVFTPSIGAGLGGMGLDIFWYLITPIGMIAYLIYDMKKHMR